MTRDAKAIIWDLDKTLYPYDQRFFAASKKALTNVVQEYCPVLSPTEAFAYASASYPMQTISRLQQDFGHDPKRLFYAYFTYLDESFLEPDARILRVAKQLQPHVKFGLLTHGNRDWSDRAIKRLGWDSLIPHAFRQTIDTMNHEKDTGSAALEELLSVMAVLPDKTVVVDDKDRNLGPAAALGCHTVLVTNRDPDPCMKVQHAQFVYDCARDFLNDYKRNGFNLVRVRLKL